MAGPAAVRYNNWVASRMRVIAHFDRWAPTYDDCELQPLYDAAHRAVLDALGTTAGGPRRMLDVGCGTGRLLRHAAELFPDALRVGVDLSAGMLRVAALANVEVGGYVCAAAEELAFADRTFDVVTSTISMRHWTDRRLALSQIHRILAPGGMFVLATIMDFQPGRMGRAVCLGDLTAAGFLGCRIRQVAGFGPVPAITIAIAYKPASHP